MFLYSCCVTRGSITNSAGHSALIFPKFLSNDLMIFPRKKEAIFLFQLKRENRRKIDFFCKDTLIFFDHHILYPNAEYKMALTNTSRFTCRRWWNHFGAMTLGKHSSLFWVQPFSLHIRIHYLVRFSVTKQKQYQSLERNKNRDLSQNCWWFHMDDSTGVPVTGSPPITLK